MKYGHILDNINIWYTWPMTKIELLKLIDAELKPLGYQRKDKTWYKEGEDTIVMFTLDKSQYSNLYYASVHFLLKGISTEKQPKFYKSHSYFRAEYYMDEDPKKYFDLENELDKETRIKQIRKLMQKSVSILALFETIEGIKKVITLYNPRVLGIKLVAQKYLGIHIE